MLKHGLAIAWLLAIAKAKSFAKTKGLAVLYRALSCNDFVMAKALALLKWYSTHSGHRRNA